jgi:hypothetical protein
VQAATQSGADVARRRLAAPGIEGRDLDQHVGRNARDEVPNAGHGWPVMKGIERAPGAHEPERSAQRKAARMDRDSVSRGRDARDDTRP